MDEKPKNQALFDAVHAVLLHRLHGTLDTVEGLKAWNALLDAHDALADGGR